MPVAVELALALGALCSNAYDKRVGSERCLRPYAMTFATALSHSHVMCKVSMKCTVVHKVTGGWFAGLHLTLALFVEY